MLGYSVIQFSHPMHHQMMSKERGNGPVFTTSQLLLQSFEELHRFADEEIFDFGEERDSGTSEEGPGEGMQHCSGFSPNEEFYGNPTWVSRGHDESALTENQGLELVSLLTFCAESISTGNYAATNCFLSRLGELASPRGGTIQRVVAYFTEALALRAVKLWPHVFSVCSPPREISDQVDDGEDAVGLRLLNQVSPIPRFLHFTLNERLLRAFEGKDRVHIIDFDIKEGLQWPSLFQSLASRPNPVTHVRITGIGDSRHDLQETGARLRGLAESLNIQFEFHPVVDRLEDVRLWMLHVKEGECVAVNCVLQLHKALYDENQEAALMDLLGLIRSTNPAILLVAEEEAENNDPRWELRFVNSLKYYSAVFDAVDSTLLPEDSAARIKIEEMFARRIRNIVSCEGAERTERHEKFDKWREMMEDGGFSSMVFGEREAIQGRMLLRMYSYGENYSVEMRENGVALTLKWIDQPLYTVSAWAPPISVPGSPSASQPG